MSKRMTPEEVEARTIYIPIDDRTRLVTVHLYEAERKRGVAAADLAPYALSDAANVLQLIHEGLSLGHFDKGDPGLISLASICAQHFRRLAENEGEHLAQLAQRLNTIAPTEGKGEEG